MKKHEGGGEKNCVKGWLISIKGKSSFHTSLLGTPLLHTTLLRALRSKKDDEGSAVVEFVLIAIPLFLPALLFFSSMHNAARTEIDLTNLARQSLRAFVTAESLNEGHQRVRFVLDRFSELEASEGSFSQDNKFTYNISCGAERCHSPGTMVRIELFRSFKGEEGRNRKAVAVAQGYVDKWRSES